MNTIELGKIIVNGQQTDETLQFTIHPFDTRSMLVSGITGSRKTTLLMKLLKRLDKLKERPQQVIISSEGEEQKLRTDYPIIIIGNRGEIPIDLKLARQMGRLVRISKLDFIVNIATLKLEKERDEFLADFLDGMLVDDEQQYWNNTCVVVIDELQKYCKRSWTRARDSIVNLTTLGKKRGLVLIGASHSVKDVYYEARKEIDNRIIGYMREENELEAAAELLTMKSSEKDVFMTLDGTGDFFVWGSSICKVPTRFHLESEKVEQEERFVVPVLSMEYREKAEKIMKKLDLKNDIPIETILRIENEQLRTENMKLAENQFSEEIRMKEFDRGRQMGIMQANEQNITTIKNIIKTYEEKSLNKIFKNKIRFITVTKKSDGTESIHFDREDEN